MKSQPSHAHLPGAAAEPVACLVRELTGMEAVTCSHLPFHSGSPTGLAPTVSSSGCSSPFFHITHASAAPPIYLPPTKTCGNVTAPVRSCTEARISLPRLLGAYSSASKLRAEYSTPIALSSLKTVQQNSHDSIATTVTLPDCTNSVSSRCAAAVGSGSGCGKATEGGTPSRKACSSAVISAGIPSKSGVERYRSPVSGSIATIVEPAGNVLAFCSATCTIPPPLVPVKRPS
eukprot:scaffold118722_cov60-Phaeocystis_antarctica.AAC.4